MEKRGTCKARDQRLSLRGKSQERKYAFVTDGFYFPNLDRGRFSMECPFCPVVSYARIRICPE